MPFIASHPGHIPKNRVETAMVSAYDMMPTLLETLDLPIPSTERNLPGQSSAPLLADRLRPADKPSKGHECVAIYDKYGSVRMVMSHLFLHRRPPRLALGT